MIPIPKGHNTDLTSIKKSRGIALSSLLSEIFDNCIIYAQTSFLLSDDLQFAYKPDTSTLHCVSLTTETINYYLNNSSNVYICTLDASKAFDRVNLLALFQKLYDKKMCSLYLRL